MQSINQLVLDENNIAFHPMIGNSYQLNPIASEIIKLIKLDKTKEKILEELVLKYDVDKEKLYIDISDFFSKLRVYGLVK